MPDRSPKAWSVVARNLPEHAGNAIHTDEGARAAGFPSALVAGVTTYAYLTHPLVDAWGLDWLRSGRASVRFRAPVIAERTIECRPSRTPDGHVTVDAVDPLEDHNPRAMVDAAYIGDGSPDPRDGERLESRRFVLEGRYGTDYGARAGDDLTLYERENVVHPAVWPAIANNIFSTDLVRGSWIHTRSTIRHHAVAHGGDVVDVHAVVVDRFHRHGERAVVDVVIERGDTVIATLEHEAIIDLTAA